MFFSVWRGLSYIWLQEPHKYLHAVSRHVGQLSKTQIHSSTGCINCSWDCVLNRLLKCWSVKTCAHDTSTNLKCSSEHVTWHKKKNTFTHYFSMSAEWKEELQPFYGMLWNFATSFFFFFLLFVFCCVPMSLWLNSVSLSSLGKGQFSLRQRTRNSAEAWGRVAETRHHMEYSADQTSYRRTWIEQSTRTDRTAGLTWQSPAETGIILTAWHVSGLI